MDFISGQTLLEVCEKEQLPISEVMKQREISCGGMQEETIREKLYEALGIMKNAVEEPIKNPKKSIGGLIGGEAKLVADHEGALLPCAARRCQERLPTVWRYWKSTPPWD